MILTVQTGRSTDGQTYNRLGSTWFILVIALEVAIAKYIRESRSSVAMNKHHFSILRTN